MSLEAPRTPESAPVATTELFDPSTQTWQEVKEDILELEELCFPGKGFEESYLRENFENPDSIIALLRKKEKIIGFSYAIPDEETEDSVHIDTTEIHPEEQGKGHVVSLIAMLEGEARKRGYKFLTRNAAIENGYADKILKNYEGRITETHENDSAYGRQRYFKISL